MSAAKEPGWCASCRDTKERAEKAEAERDDAREWVRSLTARGRTLTCVYCGYAYPPGSPTHGAEVLTEHIKVCPKHPMVAVLARAEAAEKRAAALVELAEELIAYTPKYFIGKHDLRKELDALLSPTVP